MFPRMLINVVIMLLWGMANVAYATNLPFEKSSQQQTDTGKVDRPEPTDLRTDWWQYFEVDGKELETRIQQTLQNLGALIDELPQDVAVAARPSIELIRANLEVLPKAKAQKSPDPPAPPAYAEDYSLQELLKIADQRRTLETSLQAEREDVAVLGKVLKAARRRLDTLVAAYLRLSSSAPDRVLRGLEIMAERSAIAVADERLRVRKAALSAEETSLKQLSRQQTVAAERLAVTPGSLEQLRKQVTDAKRNLKDAQSQSVGAQTRVLSVVGEDPEEKATAHYRQQQAVRAAVVEAIANVRLIKLQAEFNLTVLLLDQVDVATGSMQAKLSEWQSLLQTIRERTVAWRSSSERERERAGDLVASAPSQVDVPTRLTFINLLNQNRLDLAQETLVSLQRLESEIEEANLIIKLDHEQLLAKAGLLASWLIRSQQALAQLRDEAKQWMSASLFKLGDTPVTALGLLRMVLILTIAWWISYWLRHVLKRLGERGGDHSQSALYTVGRLSHYLIMTVGFIVSLSSIGIDFTNFALFASAMAVGIGFGLQSIVNNFVSGLILLFDRSLKVGDFVELASGIAGEVREIKVRSTVINTNDNVDMVVPNSEFMNTMVTNWTLLEAYRRIHIPFKVAYGTDKELVRKAGLEAAERLPHTLLGIPGRNPGVWLVGFGDSGLDFELVVWVTPRAVKRPGAVNAAYMWEIETALRKHGIEVPLPQRDLHLRSGFVDAEKPRPELAASNAGVVSPRLKKS